MKTFDKYHPSVIFTYFIIIGLITMFFFKSCDSDDIIFSGNVVFFIRVNTAGSNKRGYNERSYYSYCGNHQSVFFS